MGASDHSLKTSAVNANQFFGHVDMLLGGGELLFLPRIITCKHLRLKRCIAHYEISFERLKLFVRIKCSLSNESEFS